MSTKNKNPYNRGNYHDLFTFMKKNQVINRQQVFEHAVETLGMTEKGANASVTVLLSPRLTSKRGDCRGNISAMGHIYYMEKLARKFVKGIKEPQKLRLRYRKEDLEPRKRIAKESVEAKKVKATEKVTSPTKTQKTVTA